MTKLPKGGNVWDFSRGYLKYFGYEGNDQQTDILKDYLLRATGFSEESAHAMTTGMEMPVPNAENLKTLISGHMR
jgi:hypothetical protein